MKEVIIVVDEMENKDPILAHLEALMEQEAQMKQRFPDFELQAALDEPMFLKLTSPCVGLSLMDAYCALHWAELAAQALDRGMEALCRSIRSGGDRPRELADSHGGFFSPNPAAMSRAERQALKKRIYDAKALGEKIYPAAWGR